MRRVVSFLCASLVAACGGQHDDRHAPAPSAAMATPPVPATTAPEAAPGIPEAEVRAAFEAWLGAQNRGDFAAYEPLYAERFQGVRRNAERTRSFDRRGWLEDRRRMFRRPMTVAATEVVVHTAASGAEVEFVQRWSSGTYADEGPKRIRFVREGGALKIAVEEMLAARALDDVAASLAIGTFVALPSDRGPIAFLAGAPAETPTGSPRLLGAGDPMLVAAGRPETFPAAIRALVGREVTVVERRRSCPGTITAVDLVAAIVPHFGMVQQWNGDEDGDGSPDRAVVPAEQRAAEAWALESTASYAAIVRSECREPVAVSFVPRDSLSVYVPRVPDAGERTTLERAFERTRRFRDREAEYATYVAGLETPVDSPSPPGQREAWRRDASIVVFAHEARTVASVVQNSEGCGGFDVSGWAGFELTNRGATELPEPTTIGDYVSIMSVFDAGNDGTLEAIVRWDLASYAVIRFAPTASVLHRVRVDYHDCSC